MLEELYGGGDISGWRERYLKIKRKRKKKRRLGWQWRKNEDTETNGRIVGF